MIDKRSTIGYQLIQRGVYPLTMTLSVFLFFALLHADQKHLLATSIPILFSVLVIIVCERYMPYSLSWKPDFHDLKNDGLYFLLVQTVLPNLLVWLTALFTLRYIKANDLVILHVWPSHLPIWIQEVMVVLISDFLRYWLHRFSHTTDGLWRLHAVHHSVQKLYWLNTARFHPVEKSLQFMMDVFPFMLIGISEEVIALHLVLYGVNGFFQHSNIDLKFGWLNYIVSSAELHRWHHSLRPEESNSNYGNNVIVWDLLFGSYYLPKEREVEELGLKNRNYPVGFQQQMKAPFVTKLDKIDLPEISLWHLFLNYLLMLKIALIKVTVYRTFIEGTKQCDKIQKEVLLKLIDRNKHTLFGKEYRFDKIRSYEDYKNLVPIGNYESLSPYIKTQAADQKTMALISDEILMFNKTSGTTAEPKLIPVTKGTLRELKTSQSLMVYQQYRVQPHAYYGKIVGIASPAIEGMSEYNIPIGSASGHFYKNVSRIVESKYVIPYEVLEITDYELKYYVILLFCLQHRDITCIATANPTTLIKLTEILNGRKSDLLRDLKSGSVSGLTLATYPNLVKALQRLKPAKSRINEIEKLVLSALELTFKQLWPHLKLLATWTGGSCGITLRSVLAQMPEDISVIDLGYLSSEIRGTVTFDSVAQSGLPSYQNNFFEFVERHKWEEGSHEFMLLHELVPNREYYIFITTQAGLYRYNMNDIIRVSGFVNQCPLIRFIQKGKGVCNITGEKLYESQLLVAFGKLSINFIFVQVVANEEAFCYECYVELNEDTLPNGHDLSDQLDAFVCEQNNEYREKRASGRLKRMEIKQLKRGTFDYIKRQAVLNGQNEGQYKTMLLQYKKNLPVNLDQFVR